MKSIIYIIGLFVGLLLIVKRLISTIDGDIEDAETTWVYTQLASLIAKDTNSVSINGIYHKLKKKDFTIIPKEYNKITLEYQLLDKNERSNRSIKKNLTIHNQNGNNISITATVAWLSLPSSIRHSILSDKKTVERYIYPHFKS
ncbi:MAG: hypothetical protein JXA91_04530 [Candidatus Thermoplasmatota archaeon]|nr:hypothetical protein [Candidatus Thermoplasmatota archaeon]